MALIKVTGYIETDDLPASFVDTISSMGLTNEGYEAIMGYRRSESHPHEGDLKISSLDDVEFEYEG